jgi:hypothetical protein
LCVLTVLKEMTFDLVWSCFAASNGPCKAVPRSGYDSSFNVTFLAVVFPAQQSGSLFKLCVSV